MLASARIAVSTGIVASANVVVVTNHLKCCGGQAGWSPTTAGMTTSIRVGTSAGMMTSASMVATDHSSLIDSVGAMVNQGIAPSQA